MKNTHPGKNGEVIKKLVTPPQVTIANSQKITDNSSPQPVDNPNAIKVIMTASAPSSALSKAEVALQVHQQRQQRFDFLDNQQHQEQMASSFVSLPPQSDCRASTDHNSDNGSGDAVIHTFSTPRQYVNADTNKQQYSTTTQQRASSTTKSGVINGPIKLAFKTSAFKSSYNINRSVLKYSFVVSKILNIEYGCLNTRHTNIFQLLKAMLDENKLNILHSHCWYCYYYYWFSISNFF